MTKEQAKKNAEVMLAYSRGEPIQVLWPNDKEWTDIFDEDDCPSFNFEEMQYRLRKPCKCCGR